VPIAALLRVHHSFAGGEIKRVLHLTAPQPRKQLPLADHRTRRRLHHFLHVFVRQCPEATAQKHRGVRAQEEAQRVALRADADVGVRYASGKKGQDRAVARQRWHPLGSASASAAAHVQLRLIRDKQTEMAARRRASTELQKEVRPAAVDCTSVLAVQRRDLVCDGGVAVSRQSLIPKLDPRQERHQRRGERGAVRSGKLWSNTDADQPSTPAVDLGQSTVDRRIFEKVSDASVVGLRIATRMLVRGRGTVKTN
jgi:hypothetical protein